MSTIPAHHKFIMEAEGFRSKPYLCSAGVHTIGYGSIRLAGGDRVSMFTPPVTEAEAYALLVGHLKPLEASVRALLKVTTPLNQFGALVSLAYNIGCGSLSRSTLLRLHNLGRTEEAADQFLVWNKVRQGGAMVPVPGLTNRRIRERDLYLTP